MSLTHWEIIVIQNGVQMFVMHINRYEQPDEAMVSKMAKSAWCQTPERVGEFKYREDWEYVIQKYSGRRFSA